MERPVSRRRTLGIVTGGVAGLAGCLGDDASGKDVRFTHDPCQLFDVDSTLGQGTVIDVPETA